MEKLVELFQERVRHKRVEEEFHIQHNNDRRCRPAKNFQPELVRKFAHLRPFVRESQQGPNGKAELHR